MAGMVHIKKKKTILTFVCIFTLCTEHFTLEVTGAQSWSYYIGPKKGEGPRLSNQAVFAPYPLKVAWSGILCRSACKTLSHCIAAPGPSLNWLVLSCYCVPIHLCVWEGGGGALMVDLLSLDQTPITFYLHVDLPFLGPSYHMVSGIDEKTRCYRFRKHTVSEFIARNST